MTPVEKLPPHPLDTIAKYFSKTVDVQTYSRGGRKLPGARPERCPLCKGKCRPVGHGWYTRKGLWDGTGHSAQSFEIHRFRCTNTGKTFSLHPPFSHRNKFYSLHSVVESVRGKAPQGRRPHPRTVQRWKAGLVADAAYKAQCLAACVTAAPEHGILGWLMDTFAGLGEGVVATGASLAMIRLAHEFGCALY